MSAGTEASKTLRKPFPAEEVGKLPKTSCGDCSKAPGKVCDRHQKAKCRECGAYITSAHVHLDYVGHAGVTNRLLDADPAWWWEPVAWDADGAPLVQYGKSEAVMWVRLTVGGVTRYGVGSAPVGSFELHKQLVSDAIRNASMRFGVALALWAKEPLPEMVEQEEPVETRPRADKAVVADLAKRMGALAPDDYRAECKRQFVAVLGKPADLLAEDADAAEVMVAKFEQEETDPTCAPSAHVSLLAEPTTPTASATGAGGENDQGAGQPADLAGKDPESLMGEAEDPLPAPEDAWSTVDKAAFDRWQRGARATANGALSANKDEYQAQWEALVYAASGGTQTSSKALTKDQCGWLKTRLMDLSSGKGRLVETDDAQYLGWKVDV